MQARWRISLVLGVLSMFGAAAASAAPEVTVRGHGFTDPTVVGADLGPAQFTANVRVAPDGTVSGILTVRFGLPGKPSLRVVARAECALVGDLAIVGGPVTSGVAGESYIVFVLDSNFQRVQILTPFGGPFPGRDACVDVGMDTRDFIPLVRGEVVISGV
jgi:hypothetical protein